MNVVEKKVFVTGGSKGIGKAVVKGFLAQGDKVSMIGRSEERLLEIADQFQNELRAGRLLLFQTDVSDRASLNKTVIETASKFGEIDVLVNNAGISIGSNILEISEEDWWEDIHVNLGGAFNCCHVIAPIMAEQKRGSIVNVSSQAARLGNHKPNYSSSKAGLIGLTKSLARTLGPFNVRANAILPSVIETEMISDWSDAKRAAFALQIPLRRLGKAEEVADVVLFLASEKSSYLNGAIIDVHGGGAN